MLSRRRQWNRFDFLYFDANRLCRREASYLIHRFLNLPLPVVGVAGARNDQQSNLIGSGLMKLKIGDSLAAIHQVSEILAVHDAATWQEKIVGGAGDFKPHQREIVTARAMIWR